MTTVIATAVASVNAYPKGVDNTTSRRYVYGTIAIAASPDVYSTNGLTCDLSALAAADGAKLAEVTVVGDTAEYSYNMTSAGKLIVLDHGTELAASAVPAAVSDDNIRFKAEYIRGF